MRDFVSVNQYRHPSIKYLLMFENSNLTRLTDLNLCSKIDIETDLFGECRMLLTIYQPTAKMTAIKAVAHPYAQRRLSPVNPPKLCYFSGIEGASRQHKMSIQRH